MKYSARTGFTTVELMITLFIGALFVGAFSQLYNVSIQSTAEATNYSKASSAGYELLRRQSESVSSTCVASTTTPALTDIDTSGLPIPVSAKIVVDCPYLSTTPSISRITVTISYGSGTDKMEVVHAMLKGPEN